MSAADRSTVWSNCWSEGSAAVVAFECACDPLPLATVLKLLTLAALRAECASGILGIWLSCIVGERGSCTSDSGGNTIPSDGRDARDVLLRRRAPPATESASELESGGRASEAAVAQRVMEERGLRGSWMTGRE